MALYPQRVKKKDKVNLRMRHSILVHNLCNRVSGLRFYYKNYTGNLFNIKMRCSFDAELRALYSVYGTMMHAAVIGLLALLLIPSGHCRPQVTSSSFEDVLEAVPFLTTGSINKRQILGTCSRSQAANILADYPQDCLSQFRNLDVSNIMNEDAARLTARYRIICQPRCGNPILTFYNRCGLSRYGHAARGICTRNDAGRFCYEEFDTLLPNDRRVVSECISRRSFAQPAVGMPWSLWGGTMAVASTYLTAHCLAVPAILILLRRTTCGQVVESVRQDFAACRPAHWVQLNQRLLSKCFCCWHLSWWPCCCIERLCYNSHYYWTGNSL